MLWIVLWLLCGIAAAVVYANKGRSAIAALLVGLLLGPVGVLLALLTPTDTAALERRQVARGELRRCPACAELVRPDAARCRHCGADLVRR